MLSDTFNLEQFNANGFCVVRDVLTPAELSQLRSIIEKLARWEVQTGAAHLYAGNGELQRVWNLLNKAPGFQNIVCRDIVVDALDKIFDRPTSQQKYFLSSLQANILRPGAVQQKVHIDTPVPEPLPPWIIKANTIWLLDDFTSINGATEVIPGTHKLDYKPRADDPALARLQTVTAPAGSVLFTHGALWHRSGANQSSATRTVILGSFAASFAREIANEENIVGLVDETVRQGFSETLKRIVGFDHGIKVGSLQPPPDRG